MKTAVMNTQELNEKNAFNTEQDNTLTKKKKTILKNAPEKIRYRHIATAIIVLKALLVGYIVIKLLPANPIGLETFDNKFFWFVVAGFVAQMIDGTLGMAYGVSCSTLLLNMGIPPKVASAAVHTAEVFTTGVSGLSHLKFNNLDKPLFIRIVFFGVIGAVAGAWLISSILDGDLVKPYIMGYLLILGFVVLYKGIRNKETQEPKQIKHVGKLALAGGLLDAIGGGGWGPIVTSNLISKGNSPRKTIGTVNTAEFFVTFSSTGVFIFLIGIESLHVILALVAGGILAAPLGAYIASRMPKKLLMILVGSLIIIVSTISLIKIFS